MVRTEIENAVTAAARCVVFRRFVPEPLPDRGLPRHLSGVFSQPYCVSCNLFLCCVCASERVFGSSYRVSGIPLVFLRSSVHVVLPGTCYSLAGAFSFPFVEWCGSPCRTNGFEDRRSHAKIFRHFVLTSCHRMSGCTPESDCRLRAKPCEIFWRFVLA